MNTFNTVETDSQTASSTRLIAILRTCLCTAAICWGQSALAETAATPEQNSAGQPITTSVDGDLQFWKLQATGLGEPEWVSTCTVPFPPLIPAGGSVEVRMDSNSYGCFNDDARGFKIVNGGKVIIGFFDDKCTDGNKYDDDNYEYKVTQAALNTPLIRSLVPSVAVGQEVTAGLVYYRGGSRNGIDGKLSCVVFWPIP